MLTFLKKNWLLIAIILLGTIVRFYTALHYGDFWGDEMFSFVYSQKPLLLSLHYWTLETNPPLFTALLKLWFIILPANEFFARLPSILAGIASIIALYFLLLRIKDKKTALYAALILALSPYHIFISATARGYAILLLLTILSYYFFYRLFIEKAIDKRLAIGFGIVTTLLLYTHLTALSVIGTQLIWVIVTRDLASLKRIGTLLFAPFLLWLPWAVPSLLTKLNSTVVGQSWFFSIPNVPIVGLVSVQPLFTGFGSLLLLKIVLAVLMLALIFFFYRAKTALDRPPGSFLFLLLVALLPVLSALIVGLWNIKFFLVALPLCAGLIAYLLSDVIRSRIIAIFIIAVLTIPGCLKLYHYLPVENWQTVNTYIAARLHPNHKQLLIYSNFTDTPRVERYYHEPVLALPYYIPKDGLTWDDANITENYLRSSQTLASMEMWYNTDQLAKYNDIFVLESTTIGNIDLPKLLTSHGWEQTEPPVTPDLLGGYSLEHFVRSPVFASSTTN